MLLAFLDSWINPIGADGRRNWDLMGPDYPHRSPGALQNEVNDKGYRIIYADKYQTCQMPA